MIYLKCWEKSSIQQLQKKKVIIHSAHISENNSFFEGPEALSGMLWSLKEAILLQSFENGYCWNGCLADLGFKEVAYRLRKMVE